MVYYICNKKRIVVRLSNKHNRDMYYKIFKETYPDCTFTKSSSEQRKTSLIKKKTVS